MSCFISYNPTTGEEIGSYPIAAPEEVACASARAQEATEGWAQRSVAERCQALQTLRALIAERADTLAAAIHAEIGKPLQEAYGAEVLPSLQALDWLTAHAPHALRPRAVTGVRNARLTPLPYGVVGVIGTWNYPLFLNLTPIAWALAAGNTVVWKPSELAAASSLLLAACFQQAGLPVVTVTGDGTTGRALCRTGCGKIAFTGSVTTGRAILAELAASGTPVVMELSGKDAMVVCADADIALAARSAVWGRCCNAGQSCVAPQVVYVARAVYHTFLEECRREIEALRPGVDYGPLRTPALRARVHTMVWDAVPRGARLLTGGFPLDDRPGYHYAPTLLADCNGSMLVTEQDFFGPVLAVCPVRDAEEAIAPINAGEMALSASIWTRSRSYGCRIADCLQVGMVTINAVLLDAANPALPFGGLRASGFGKQRGLSGLEEFVQWKTTVTHRSGGAHRHLFPYRPATLPILQGLIALKAARGPVAKWKALRRLAEAARHWKYRD